jgi:alkyl hydroperoxide reductase subunit AhpC
MVVQRQVLRRLREIYSTVAADNYAAVAAQFDKAAKQFTDLAATCDVKADAATIIDKPDKVRRAFLDAESHANAINRLLPALAAAATLARGFDTMPQQTQDGAMVTVSKHGPANSGWGDGHRQQTW